MYISTHSLCSLLRWSTFSSTLYPLFKSDAASLAYLFLGSFTHSSLQNLSSSISLDGERHSRRFTERSQSWFFVILAVYSRALWSRLSSGMSLYVAAFIFHSTLTRLTIPAAPQHNAATTVLPIGMALPIWEAVPGFLQTWCLAFKSKSSIFVLLEQKIVFLIVWESFRWLLVNSRWAVMSLLLSGFPLATLSCRSDC